MQRSLERQGTCDLSQGVLKMRGLPYETTKQEIVDFLKALEDGTPCPPTFRDAYETAKVCDAVLDSARTRAWKDTGVDWKGS